MVDPKNLSELAKHVSLVLEFNLYNIEKILKFQLIRGLLMRNSQCHMRLFAKIDVQIVEETQFFGLQITKCGPGHPNLRFLINTTFADMRNEVGQSFPEKRILAIVISKSLRNPKKLDVKKVFLGCKSDFAMITSCTDDYKHLLWNELNSLKQFTLIKLNVKIFLYLFDNFQFLQYDFFVYSVPGFDEPLWRVDEFFERRYDSATIY